jgi:uncharacterized membrane protein HdeD (DUF308 family)
MLGLSRRALAIIAIVAGVLIILFPFLVVWIVGIFLIVWGILALVGRKQ